MYFLLLNSVFYLLFFIQSHQIFSTTAAVIEGLRIYMYDLAIYLQAVDNQTCFHLSVWKETIETLGAVSWLCDTLIAQWYKGPNFEDRMIATKPISKFMTCLWYHRIDNIAIACAMTLIINHLMANYSKIKIFFYEVKIKYKLIVYQLQNITVPVSETKLTHCLQRVIRTITKVWVIHFPVFSCNGTPG